VKLIVESGSVRPATNGDQIVLGQSEHVPAVVVSEVGKARQEPVTGEPALNLQPVIQNHFSLSLTNGPNKLECQFSIMLVIKPRILP
jgi:hypothetical protein